MNFGFVGFFKLKNFKSKGAAVLLLPTHACMTELQRKFIVMRSLALGQTRSSRDVSLWGMPAAFSGAGISPITVGLAGFWMFRINMPGWGCGQAFKPKLGSVRRGSPKPQRLEPSVRLPI